MNDDEEKRPTRWQFVLLLLRAIIPLALIFYGVFNIHIPSAFVVVGLLLWFDLPRERDT